MTMGRRVVLVTGVHGFIARHLRSVLATEMPGIELIGADLRGTVPPDVRRMHALDLTDAEAVGRMIAREKPDLVFHLAALVYSRSWEDLYKGNVVSTRVLLEMIGKHAPEARVVVPGSAAECGAIDPADLPLSERQPSNPVSPYGVAKVWQISLARYFASTGLDVVVPRMFNVIGRGAPEGLSIGAFASQLRRIRRGELEPIIRVGNLRPRRDFLDGSDAARGLLAVASHARTGEILNVCAGNSVSMQQVLDWMISRIGRAVEVVVDQDRVKKNDIDDIFGSYGRLNERCGWTPRVPLEESVAQMMDPAEV